MGAIFQIIDFCHRQVLSGAWAPEERVPSTKELAVTLTVNNRTVMKAYDELAAEGVIYQRRGMGYYAAPDASERVREALRRHLLADTAPPPRRASPPRRPSPRRPPCRHPPPYVIPPPPFAGRGY